MKLYVGIDPGLTGAVAVIDEEGALRDIFDAPTAVVKKGKGNRTVYLDAQMADLLSLDNLFTRGEDRDVFVTLENVHAMPGQGVTSMFSMGTGFGLWLGIIAALRLPYQRVEPARWKKDMGIPTGSPKDESRVRAMRLFPSASSLLARKKDDGRADALLIAEWARQKGGPIA